MARRTVEAAKRRILSCDRAQGDAGGDAHAGLPDEAERPARAEGVVTESARALAGTVSVRSKQVQKTC